MGDLGAAVRLQTADVDGAGQTQVVVGSGRPDKAEGHPAALEGGSRLRRRLVATDVLMVLLAWALTPLAPWAPDDLPRTWWAVAPAMILATVGLVLLAGLYRARVCSVRATEVVRLAYVSGAVGVAGLASASLVGEEVSQSAVTAAAAGFFFLGGGRAVFRDWLLAQRATGRIRRTVAIIGADEEASRLGAHLEEHPELGYSVAGFFRSAQGHAAHLARPVLGQVSDAAGVLRELGITGAIVVPGALAPAERDAVLATLVEAKVHVHLATGLRGVDSRRLRSLPMGHEPLLYLEPAGMTAPVSVILKRGIDIVGATVALTLTAPLLLVAAVATKLTDGGPVVFRQERMGKGNRPFSLYKLRSMTVDAEARLDEVIHQNQRNGGPLFKLDNDPRVTRVGAILRATSLDEIPQLFNVLRGEMSLVGPRPALPHEVAAFDEELLIRQQVRPGVTGLWQVEARDNPSFAAYRYLDVFYVENQSLALDLTILMATVRAVARSLRRALHLTRRRPALRPAVAAIAAEGDELVATS